MFKGFEGNYQLPQEVQDKLTFAQPPFDDVDLIIVTHAHGDHVDLEMVRQHMQNNPVAFFASTQQLVDALNDSTDRCIGFNPTKEKPESKVINDISIEAFYLPHGPDARIINIGFLISVNGITIFKLAMQILINLLLKSLDHFNYLKEISIWLLFSTII